jgi:hypothetical protein
VLLDLRSIDHWLILSSDWGKQRRARLCADNSGANRWFQREKDGDPCNEKPESPRKNAASGKLPANDRSSDQADRTARPIGVIGADPYVQLVLVVQHHVQLEAEGFERQPAADVIDLGVGERAQRNLQSVSSSNSPSVCRGQGHQGRWKHAESRAYSLFQRERS